MIDRSRNAQPGIELDPQIDDLARAPNGHAHRVIGLYRDREQRPHTILARSEETGKTAHIPAGSWAIDYRAHRRVSG